MKEKNAVLLLTGTVNPGGMVLTAIQDVEVRKNQYLEAIRFWLKTTDLPIVFVENSGTDLSGYFQDEIARGVLEMRHFNGNNYDKQLGKGIGELRCLEYACAHSPTIQQAAFVFKVTGRYKVLNFSTFLKEYRTEQAPDLLVDFKWNLSFCDSRFFGFSPQFVPDFLSNQGGVINDSAGVYLEHALSKAALTAIAAGYAFRPFRTLPRIEGYSATVGVRYNSAYLHWLRYKFEYDLKHRSFGLGNLPWI